MNKDIEFSFRDPDRSIPSAVGVRISMDYYYKIFLDSIVRQSNSTEDRFLAGVQCIVWGSLCVEAVINRVCVRLLSPSKGSLEDQPSIWYLAEKAEMDKKVEALADQFGGDKDTAKKHNSQLRRLAKIRNRLFHYKDAPTNVDPAALHWDDRGRQCHTR